MHAGLGQWFPRTSPGSESLQGGSFYSTQAAMAKVMWAAG